MMNLLNKKITFGKYRFGWPEALCYFLTALGVVLELSRGLNSVNNFLIFRGVFHHTIAQANLYLQYPQEYSDANHYGPSFSLLIAPFSVINIYISCFFWCIANTVVLLYAIKKLPLNQFQINIIFLLISVELMTSTQSVQFNPMLTGWMILAFVFVHEKKDFWATFFIAIGFLLKLYGIAALAFFLFSDNKIKFIISFIFWLIIIFCMPMLISSPEFVLQSYQDWMHSLIEKNTENINSLKGLNLQDISVMGVIRRVFNYQELSALYVLVTACVLFALPYLRISQYKQVGYRLGYLSLVLISVVIFSSSAESPTYIIAVTGAAIWLSTQAIPLSKWHWFLVSFMFIFTCLSPTDLFPHSIRVNFFVAYALKALPFFFIWLTIVYQLLTHKWYTYKASTL